MSADRYAVKTPGVRVVWAQVGTTDDGTHAIVEARRAGAATRLARQAIPLNLWPELRPLFFGDGRTCDLVFLAMPDEHGGVYGHLSAVLPNNVLMALVGEDAMPDFARDEWRAAHDESGLFFLGRLVRPAFALDPKRSWEENAADVWRKVLDGSALNLVDFVLEKGT